MGDGLSRTGMLIIAFLTDTCSSASLRFNASGLASKIPKVYPRYAIPHALKILFVGVVMRVESFQNLAWLNMDCVMSFAEDCPARFLLVFGMQLIVLNPLLQVG